MSSATENNENAVIESKRSEDYKSPGRLKAEEKAEKIRYAEEYRKKLEAEKEAQAPKKTKAAEQKEQAKIEKAEREQEERRAQVEAATQEASRHVSEASERLAALAEKIERTESELSAKREEKANIATVELPVSAFEKPEPVEIDDLVVKIPVVSFSAPCAVKRKKPRSAPPQMMPPPFCPPPMPTPPIVYITNNVMPAQQEVKIEKEPVEIKKPEPVSVVEPTKPRFVFVAPPVPSPKKKPKIQPIDLASSFGNSSVRKPAITYGTTLSEGGWEDEIDDEDQSDCQDVFSGSTEARDLISDLANASAAADSSASEAQRIAEALETELE